MAPPPEMPANVECEKLSTRREFLRLAAIAGAGLLLNTKGCNRADDEPFDPSTTPARSRSLNGGTDITFFVAADTHFGFRGIEKLNARQIKAMNSLPGTALPAEIGGAVQKPMGVLVAGDLTESGRGAEWKQFVRYYGLAGGDGRLKYPVYECTGNHDRDTFLFRPALDGVKRRHGSLTYSWDWGDVHLACLDCYPDAANLRWLRRDLARVGRKIPIVLYFHYSITGPYSDWWTEREKAAFRSAIEGFNVIGIFHGHFHASTRYKWHGYDVYNVGSPRHGWHSFAVVRITDTTMTVISRNWDTDRWNWWHAKAINSAASEGVREKAGVSRW